MDEIIEQYKDIAVVLLGMAAVFCILKGSAGAVQKIVEQFLCAVLFR